MVPQKEHDNSPGTQFNVKEDCDLSVREYKTSVMNKFDKLQKKPQKGSSMSLGIMLMNRSILPKRLKV